MYLDLVPLKRVGPFEFGKSIDSYHHLSLIEIPEEYDKEVNWRVYSVKNKDIRIYSDKGIITAIACYDECFFNNINIIGLSFDEFKSNINLKPTGSDKMELDDGIKEVYDFDELAIEVFVKDGIIISVNCCSKDK